jgi:diadenosine tetraphosphatase ApaH/serine/threonine PP2A family protein phosphatase
MVDDNGVSRRIVNDGSAGLPLDGDPRPVYVLLDFTGDECAVTVRRVKYDHEAVIAELERVDHPAKAWVGGILRMAKG